MLPEVSGGVLGERPGRLNTRLKSFIEADRTQRFIIAVIVFNALCIGLETSASVMEKAGGLLRFLDKACLAIFVIELSIKLVVYRLRFFLSGWNVFDFLIIGIALVPATGSLSVLRALRVLRAVRLVSVVPSMRVVVQALLAALPNMGAVAALLSLVFYVGSVMATNLFGADFPDWFGSIGASLYSLFQIMTLESWSMGIVRPVMEKHPYAWAFFVPFILVSTFSVLNLFVAVVVNSMQSAASSRVEDAVGKVEDAMSREELLIRTLSEKVDSLVAEVRDLKDKSGKS